MAKVIGFVGEVFKNECPCAKCGTELRGDHGFALDNNTAVCKDTFSCGHIVARKRLDSNVTKPRWR